MMIHVPDMPVSPPSFSPPSIATSALDVLRTGVTHCLTRAAIHEPQ